MNRRSMIIGFPSIIMSGSGAIAAKPTSIPNKSHVRVLFECDKSGISTFPVMNNDCQPTVHYQEIWHENFQGTGKPGYTAEFVSWDPIKLVISESYPDCLETLSKLSDGFKATIREDHGGGSYHWVCGKCRISNLDQSTMSIVIDSQDIVLHSLP